MKKFGYFLLGFVPLALCFVLQIGAGFIFAILSKLFMNIPGIGPEELTYSQWEDMLLSTDANGTLGIIFSLLCILIFGIWYYQTCGGNYLPKPKKTFNTMSVAGTVFIAPGIQFLSSIVLVIIAFVMPKAIEQYQQLHIPQQCQPKRLAVPFLVPLPPPVLCKFLCSRSLHGICHFRSLLRS